MTRDHLALISTELEIATRQAAAVAELLNDGATVPFISRYRKEATGSLDEVAITSIRDRLEQLEVLDKRREAIFKSLTERELLTPELKRDIENAATLSALEDIYLPHRPKRRTRATIAREKGLEPLALWLLEEAKKPQSDTTEKVVTDRAAGFVNPEKEVVDTDEALAGARDIIAELMNENQVVRGSLRELYIRAGVMESKLIKGKDVAGAKFRDYFEWSEPVRSAPGHRVLAMRRGEKEKFLRLTVAPPEDQALDILKYNFLANGSGAAAQVGLAAQECFKRLLSVAMETDIRLEMKKRADEEAIGVFAENLRQLLLAPPLGHKRVLALDPGFRTGCKLVVLDRQGKLLHNDTIYPHTGGRPAQEAGGKLTALVKKFEVEAIAVGNGTAGRETEAFVRNQGLPSSVAVVMVNESGASIYSASEAARAEFPDHDLTVRGAVSIGRRLTDPLAELVKIDPKSIGVGQYQHDVDQKALKRSLDDTVMSCVNAVGVDVNTASSQLLSYVSGLGPQLAGNVVAWRDENGAYNNRRQLLKVPRLGPKAYEQAAGFLRITGGKQPLDASAVHPESYPVVKQDRRRPGPQGGRPDRRRTGPQGPGPEPLRDRHGGLADPAGHRRRTGQARPRPPRPFRGIFLRARHRKNDRPGRGPDAARHRDERDQLRRLHRRGRAPGRPGPHQPAGRPFRARSQRGGQGGAEGAGAGARGGYRSQADFAFAQAAGLNGAPRGVSWGPSQNI